MDKIISFWHSLRDTFVWIWNDDERWWYIAGLIFGLGIVIYVIRKIVLGIKSLFGGSSWSSSSSSYSSTSSTRNSSGVSARSEHYSATVTIKGVYQLNGPKPFTKTIECSRQETSYYSQLAGNRSAQAQWIKRHYPGAKTDRGFSMAINIK